MLLLCGRVPLFLTNILLSELYHIWGRTSSLFSGKCRNQTGNGQSFFGWNFFPPPQWHPLSSVVFVQKYAVASTIAWDKLRLSCSIRLPFRCIHTILHSYAEMRQHNHSIFFSTASKIMISEHLSALFYTQKSKGIMFLTRYRQFISRWRWGKKDTSQEIMHQTVLHLLVIAGEERRNLYALSLINVLLHIQLALWLAQGKAVKCSFLPFFFAISFLSSDRVLLLCEPSLPVHV